MKRPRSGTHEWDTIEAREWKNFERGIERVSDYREALAFGQRGPRSGTPGGKFYTNLCYFLRFGTFPDGADESEREIYRALERRLGAPPKGQPQ